MIYLPSKVTSSPPAFRLSFFSIIQSSAQRSIVSQKKSPGCKKNNTLVSMYVFMLHLFHCIGILSGFIRLSKKDNIFYISNSTTTTILTITQTQPLPMWSFVRALAHLAKREPSIQDDSQGAFIMKHSFAPN